MSPFLTNLHTFFIDQSKHKLSQKVVFAPGTAPMRKENCEIEEMLFVTDFDKAYVVDPVYGVQGKGTALDIDLAALNALGSQVHISPVSHTASKATFTYAGKMRTITFIAGDATLPKFQPKEFTIFFSGKRIGLYPGFGLRGTPSEYLPEIVEKLPVGGYVVPDRSLLDDSIYFLVPPKELGLEEVAGIRVSIPRSEFPKGYSEDKRFVHSEQARGVGLYKKIR